MRLWHLICARWRWVGLVATMVAIMAMAGPVVVAGQSSVSLRHLRVVADSSYPPFLFLDARGKPQGYVVDRWRLFEKHTGIQVDLAPTTWVSAQQQIRSGQADAIDMMFRTPSREAQYGFSQPYASLPVGIYVDQGIHGVHDLATLQGFPVGVERGDACAERLREAGVTDLREFVDYQSIAKAAAAGVVHLFCMDKYPAEYFLYRDAALSRFGLAFVFYEAQFHVAVRKGDAATLQAIERGMAQITPAEQDALRKRWLDHPFVLQPYFRAAWIALAGVLLLLALLALWVGLMRRAVRARTRELRAEQEKLRGLFNASPDAITIKDRHGVYIDCNEAMAQMVGVPRERMIGKSMADVLDEESSARFRTTDDQVLASGRAGVFRSSLSVGGHGSVRHIETVKVPLFAGDGAVTGVLSTTRDITDRLQSEAQLRLWAQAFQHGSFGVVIFDPLRACITAANATFAGERGYTPKEMEGMSVDVLYPADIVAERTAARNAGIRDEHQLVETEQITRDGRRFPVLLDVTCTHAADGSPESVVVLAQDITERRRAEGELRLAAVAFQTQEALVVTDAQGIILRVNQAFIRLTGYAVAEVVGQPATAFCTHGDDAAFQQQMNEQLRREGFWQGEQWIRVKDGQARVVRTATSVVMDEAGQVSHHVCTMVDITSERAAHASVDHMTYFDPLTDLPNRHYLLGRLRQMLEEANARGGVLLLIDLDHFKRINDLHGHAAGDRLLTQVARRLRLLADGECVLGRFSGGTFALIVPCHAESPVLCAGLAWDYAERVRGCLREPFSLEVGADVTTTVSIGWAELTADRGVPDAVLKDAELAMYRAKAAGRNQVCRYEQAMHEELLRHEALVDDLRRAIDGNTLQLYLQAQVDLRGRVTGAEALLRWTRPNGERVPPNVFVAFAEKNGLILPLGDWVLRQSCAMLADWAAHPMLRGLALAVNVSAMQFAQAGFVDGVRAVLDASGVDTTRLKLEITESAILDDVATAADKLNQLRALGIRISLDDFGTGYSSLAYLSRLPLDQLKIDQSFVARLPSDANDAMVAQTIIAMGRGLGLEVIAEGVETSAQREFLTGLGCDAFQGYLFARPQPREDFEAMAVRQARVT